jgi:hypothetical protein
MLMKRIWAGATTRFNTNFPGCEESVSFEYLITANVSDLAC